MWASWHDTRSRRLSESSGPEVLPGTPPRPYVTLSRPALPLPAANNSREILGLQLADMQQYVPQDELYRAVEQALVTIVSQVCQSEQFACLQAGAAFRPRAGKPG